MTETDTHRNLILSNVKAALAIVIVFAVLELLIIVVQFNARLEQNDLNTKYHLHSIELLSKMNTELAQIRYLKIASQTALAEVEFSQNRRQIIQTVYLLSQSYNDLAATESQYGQGDFRTMFVELEQSLTPLLTLLELDSNVSPLDETISDSKLDTLLLKIQQIKRLHVNANNSLVESSNQEANINLYFVLFIGVVALIASFIVIRRFLSSIQDSLALQEQYERQLAEEKEALYKQEAENREILNFVIEGVITIDEVGTILSFNRAAENMFGLNASEIMGKNVKHIMPADVAEEHDGYLAHYNSTGEQKIIGNPRQMMGMHKDNGAFPLLLTVVELPTDEGQPRRYIGSCQDLSLIKAQEEQIRRSQKMDALGKLTGGIAHDYNNMLAIIGGYASLLIHKHSEQEGVLNYANEIEKACNRGAKLTRKLLSFSKRSAQDKELVSINESIRQMHDMLTKTLTARIMLDMKLQKALPLVELSVSDFEDAVLNMCINAMHAINGNGNIDIITRSVESNDGQSVEIDIIDTGSGMEHDVVEKVFDPFFSTKGEDGTGLGLSQVHSFVERHSGSIEVSSNPGKGSRFTLSFPVAESPPVSKPVISADRLKKQQCSGDILVVDDEHQLVEYLTTILEINGYTVYPASSALEALGVLKNNPIDLVITDVVMPGMNGFELCQQVQENYPEVQVQLVSGYAGKVSSSLIPQDILDALIEKPYDEATLINRIQSLLEINTTK